MRRFFLSALAVGLLLAGVAEAAAQAPRSGYYDFLAQRMTEPIEPGMQLLGKPAPGIKLEILGGGTFDLSTFKGKKVVVMDFWASWCQPCRIVMPAIAELAETYKDKDVTFFAVNQGEPADNINRFLTATGLKLTIALDKEQDVSFAYNVDSIPRLVIVGKDGTVQAIHIGLEGRSAEEAQANAKKRLTAELKKLLAGENLVVPQKPAQEAKSTAPER